ncbi:hypothetical protein BKA66DRAFT_248456 [Pyrenochaeta sp. MPI-SDFR-AT-0127]|nr:hypothetical protein BKA66DRAFT_248456 [Pyrenochaeta sp. MPI-SDFR-AT-0127]
MELYRPRSSSIPRQYHRRAHQERFSITDAVHLKLQLQALDNALASTCPGRHGQVDMKKIIDACRSRPFHEAVYVDGSEAFYLVVKTLSRPDLIPNVYIQAYMSAIHGRPYVNEYNVSDFNKGVDPTFSEIRVLLGSIDRLCETDLQGAYQRLEDEVKPFPFLRLPAELRLLFYAHLLPREPHIALLFQPLRDHKSPRLRLDIMRVNTKLHGEVHKYLYQNRTLFMILARDGSSKTLSDEYIARNYETLARMSMRTRQLFQKLEIQIGYLANQTFTAKRYADVSSVSDPMRHIFTMLPNLQTLVISFASSSYAIRSMQRIFRELNETVVWLISYIPLSVNLVWDLSRACPLQGKIEEQPMWSTIQERGTIIMGASVVTQLESSPYQDWRETSRIRTS